VLGAEPFGTFQSPKVRKGGSREPPFRILETPRKISLASGRNRV